ncbi:MAG TPA: hypothetical protein VE172_24765, partial [Stackebrandtia sp.]|uniref:hypothetical protein n=1 Tax=Stackebrandtia sp. TaxID=2023065 RepID=UPI002D47CF34
MVPAARGADACATRLYFGWIVGVLVVAQWTFGVAAVPPRTLEFIRLDGHAIGVGVSGIGRAELGTSFVQGVLLGLDILVLARFGIVLCRQRLPMTLGQVVVLLELLDLRPHPLDLGDGVLGGLLVL